jgi:four helix bundle protein
MRPHKKLDVYRLSIEMLKFVYEVTKQLPDDEKYGLASQLKRAAVSVPVNIAEGAARKSPKEFTQFIYISSGSLSELDALFEILHELNIIDKKQLDVAISYFERISAILTGLKRSILTKT